jgi:hypothetical protein
LAARTSLAEVWQARPKPPRPPHPGTNPSPPQSQAHPQQKPRPGREPILKKVRHLIESVNDALKGQLDREEHGGRTFEGVAVRVAQRVLAMAAGIWHNNKIGAPVTRSLVAYDH